MIDGMPRPRPKHLHRETTRHGKVVWYVHLPKQPRVRLREPYGSKEFIAEYEAAIEGKKAASEPRKLGIATLGWLIARYMDSSAWACLGLATQRGRHAIFKRIIETDGDQPFVAFEKKHILAGRERRHKTPAQANNFLKAMRGLFRWAVKSDLAGVDPTKEVETLSVKTDGFHVWTDDEVAAFEARWPIGTRERLALDLLLYTGLRRGDAVQLGRQHVRGGIFKIRTEKNGVWVEAPILPSLARSISASPTGDLSFIAGERGRPLKKGSFGNWFRSACNSAGVPGAAHGLRKAGATRAAENGATTRELKAIFGWDNDAMPSLYTRTADRARMAKGAMSMLEKTEPKANELFPHRDSGAEAVEITSTKSRLEK